MPEDPQRDSEFQRRVAALQGARGDTVQLAQVAEIVHSLVQTLEGDVSAAALRVQQELQELIDYIRHAKAEISHIRPDDISSKHIPAATDELDAVVRATEAATEAILDGAEQLGNLASQVNADVAAQINDITTRIYEASNFQDITGQRITKVVRTLRHIEEKIVKLAGAFGPGGVEAEELSTEASDDAALLNGPQLPDRASNQDDIDALFAQTG